MKKEILTAAEKRLRHSGYSELSFRDIADDVGIKSSSVHYYFRKKADLGEALVELYAERFVARLNNIDKNDLNNAMQSYIALYSEALNLNESVCLCAILAAESLGLPSQVSLKVKCFFEINIKWLEQLLSIHDKSNITLAPTILSALEGAMIISSVMNDRCVFEEVANRISQNLTEGVAKGMKNSAKPTLSE